MCFWVWEAGFKEGDEMVEKGIFIACKKKNTYN
jgi:hypothetical protein